MKSGGRSAAPGARWYDEPRATAKGQGYTPSASSGSVAEIQLEPSGRSVWQVDTSQTPFQRLIVQFYSLQQLAVRVIRPLGHATIGGE